MLIVLTPITTKASPVEDISKSYIVSNIGMLDSKNTYSSVTREVLMEEYTELEDSFSNSLETIEKIISNIDGLIILKSNE